MRQHYLTYRGKEYGPYPTYHQMLRALTDMLLTDEHKGKAAPTGVTWRTVETPDEQEEDAPCSA